MNKWQVWLGELVYLEVYSHSQRAVQDAIHANLGVWVPLDKIRAA